MSYGTIMIGKLKKTATVQSMLDALKEWEERKVDGYQGSYILEGDDGGTVVSCIVFENKAKYMTLADDPAQDEWYRKHMEPNFEGDLTWIDGTWVNM